MKGTERAGQVTAREKCTGCAACYSACPARAISMQPDSEGFAYPVVDLSKCLDCGVCVKTCEGQGRSKIANLHAYAAYAKDSDVIEKSTSGGMFTPIAQRTIDAHGVVFGAAFDENFDVRHGKASDADGIDRFRRSKYVQSDIGDAFIAAKSYLAGGREVLFSGTPCQIGGLHAYLGRTYENLTTVDILCHGVPSPKVWKKYLNAMARNAGSAVKDASFRSKRHGWGHFAMHFIFKNGTEYHCEYTSDPYLRAFLANYFLRPSCHACPYKADNRESDITIGDFWGVKRLMPQMYNKRGTSLIITNTDKGQAIFCAIKEQLHCVEVAPRDIAKYNVAITTSSKPHPERENFLRDIAGDESDVISILNSYLSRQK